jgi:DNA-binding XRE family transcriptional regulator
MNPHQQLIDDLIQIRREQGLTQTQVANTIGCSPSNITQLENTHRYGHSPTLILLLEYAHAIGAKIQATPK